MTKKPTKVLFIDIDGVVNSKETAQRHRGIIGIDPYMAFLVGKIQLDTNCKLVLSSSWRTWKEGVAEVEAQVGKLYGKTPVAKKADSIRGDEIKMWLDKHPEVVKYAIIDDDSDFHEGQPLFQTSWEHGLTPEIAKSVTDYLNDEESMSP